MPPKLATARPETGRLATWGAGGDPLANLGLSTVLSINNPTASLCIVSATAYGSGFTHGCAMGGLSYTPCIYSNLYSNTHYINSTLYYACRRVSPDRVSAVWWDTTTCPVQSHTEYSAICPLHCPRYVPCMGRARGQVRGHSPILCLHSTLYRYKTCTGYSGREFSFPLRHRGRH